jgi:outer membrane protein OmpA-like peptidoglycan-associated protein
MKSLILFFFVGCLFPLVSNGQNKSVGSHTKIHTNKTEISKLSDSTFLYTCYFTFNDADFSDSSRLVSWIHSIVKSSAASIQLSAFTDTIGSVDFNKQLAQKRLETIEKQIQSSGIPLTQRYEIGENYALSPSYSNARFRKVEVLLTLQNKQFDKSTDVVARLETFSKAKEAISLNIQFVGGKDVYLDEASMLEVTILLQFLKENPQKKAFIRGHVCCENDLELSIKRAFAVYNDLRLEGIEESRISYQGFGNTLPISPEFDEASRQLNRRVDVIFSDK